MNQKNNLFITLMAFLMSLTALAIDAILPALSIIKISLNLSSDLQAQYIISSVFLGMGIGLFFYGPLSDAWGRKKPLNLGLVIFLLGSLLSTIANSIELMLFGRFLQGFGTAACRVVAGAMIRDRFVGKEMGQIMSLIMMVFILVPAIAPAFGQIILYFVSWRYIFLSFIIMGILAIYILKIGQEETLPVEKRIPINYKNILRGLKLTCTNRKAVVFTLASGFTSGAFVGYLATSQQIFQNQLGVGEAFPFYFGMLAIFIGISSFVNSKIVLKLGLLNASNIAFISLISISTFFIFYFIYLQSSQNIFSIMSFLCLTFLFVGVLFGNLNTIAIEDLGEIAGIANSCISAIQTLISVLIGSVVGYFYTGEDIKPLVIGFFVTTLISFVMIKLLIKKPS